MKYSAKQIKVIILLFAVLLSLASCKTTSGADGVAVVKADAAGEKTGESDIAQAEKVEEERVLPCRAQRFDSL